MAEISVSMYDVADGLAVAFISTDAAELATVVDAIDVVPVKLYPLDASVGVNAATVPVSIGSAPTPTSPLPDDPTAVNVSAFWVVPVAVSPTRVFRQRPQQGCPGVQVLVGFPRLQRLALQHGETIRCLHPARCPTVRPVR